MIRPRRPWGGKRRRRRVVGYRAGITGSRSERPGPEGLPVESALVAVALVEPGARVGAVASVLAAGGAVVAAGACGVWLFGAGAGDEPAEDGGVGPVAVLCGPRLRPVLGPRARVSLAGRAAGGLDG